MQFAIRVIDDVIEPIAVFWTYGNCIQFNNSKLCGCKVRFICGNKPIPFIDESHVLDGIIKHSNNHDN